MARRDGIIPGSRVFIGGEPAKGQHDYAPCSRCGRRRQVNRAKLRHDDGLCADCRSVDPNVWRQQ